MRSQYVDQLQTASREAGRRKVEVEQARQQQMENVAAARERQLATTTLMRNQEKVKQLMERFNSLMDEGKYHSRGGRSRGRSGKVLKPLNPNNPDQYHDPLGEARCADDGLLYGLMKVAQDRQKGVVDALYQVEKSHIPFPDDPPIVYPRRRMVAANDGPAQRPV